jgi:phosphatidylglycerol:prolipoprotein diacylglycerol transferase
MLEIRIDPIIFQIGSFVVSWHGLFSVVAVAVAVLLVARWAPRYSLSVDSVYETAIWVIIGGVLGARVVAIFDDLGYYGSNPLQLVAIWRGGVAIWGGILGGLVGGVLYARYAKLPVGRLADLIAPALFLAMAIGRIGDIINGEHCTELTNAWWGFVYTHQNSAARACYNVIPNPSMHPGVVYEMLWDLVVVGILWFGLRDRIRPEGMLFTAGLALYSFGRFFILFYHGRTPDVILTIAHSYPDYVGDLNEAQLICLAVLLFAVPLLAMRARLGRKEIPDFGTPSSPPRPRAERRRRSSGR